jgi:rhodanese-related sulfurtransferase/type 1 glutamine amidotransferase
MNKAWLLLLLAFVGIGGSAAQPDRSPKIVLISAEPEYFSSNTLPVFKTFLETNYHFNCVYLERKGSNDIPGLEALDSADLAILFIRRITLPEEQLAHVKKFVDSGKPVIGLRTASHAFENWKEWDHEVLGGNYHMHHANDLVATARIDREHASHPILKNVAPRFETGGSLYKTTPLAADSTLLLSGSVEGQDPEPMAWTHHYKGARIFYTSLGHPRDFENPSFHQLLINAVFWCLDRTNSAQAVPKIGVADLQKLITGKEAVVLDVRRADEFAAGHIPGALNLNVEDPAFDEKARQLDNQKTYVVHCVHGIRSALAAEKLKQLNFNSVLDFSEGFNAWKKEAKPIEK